MQTSTSLTFFTAIFLAFSGALAEELMIFCRHVRTELYIYQPDYPSSPGIVAAKLYLLVHFIIRTFFLIFFL